MEFEKMRNMLLKLQETDYRNFVKALISIETNCTDEEKLDNMYEKFMEDDSVNLLEINEKDYPYYTKLQTLCAILNRPDKKYDSEDAFENLDHAIEVFSDMWLDCEFQIRDWLIQLKKAKDVTSIE